jgi:hypothetical protein
MPAHPSSSKFHQGSKDNSLAISANVRLPKDGGARVAGATINHSRGI